jgi:hypothetical protein
LNKTSLFIVPRLNNIHDQNLVPVLRISVTKKMKKAIKNCKLRKGEKKEEGRNNVVTECASEICDLFFRDEP